MTILRAILAMLLVASICAACGGGNSPSPTPSLYGRAVAGR
jgi:hypothetical protein